MPSRLAWSSSVTTKGLSPFSCLQLDVSRECRLPETAWNRWSLSRFDGHAYQLFAETFDETRVVDTMEYNPTTRNESWLARLQVPWNTSDVFPGILASLFLGTVSHDFQRNCILPGPALDPARECAARPRHPLSLTRADHGSKNLPQDATRRTTAPA